MATDRTHDIIELILAIIVGVLALGVLFLLLYAEEFVR